MPLVEFEGEVFNWPGCPTPDCEFLICTWAGTGLCARCSETVLGKAELDRRYTITHPDEES